MPKSRCDGGRRRDVAPGLPDASGVWVSRPAMARSKVVLPQPDGPRKQTNSPLLDLPAMMSFSAHEGAELLRQMWSMRR
jgi:hypothetical protein